ncbi:MAG: hypothetical protein HEQ13_27925 [Dolichospermum sp. DEX189]|nr:hypothetical protein [Dolichospermum sp. DEX189]
MTDYFELKPTLPIQMAHAPIERSPDSKLEYHNTVSTNVLLHNTITM